MRNLPKLDGAARWLSVTLGILASGCGNEPQAAVECDAESECGSTDETTDVPTSDASDTAAGLGNDLPCAVVEVLREHCWTCHGDPASYGAPMSLTELADFDATAVSDANTTVAERVLVRIDDEVHPMPPTGMPEADKAILRDFVEAGLPPGDPEETCDPSPPDDPPDALPCTPTHRFVAHGEADEPYDVPVVDDLYTCFGFSSPFDGPTQATAWTPIIDDERVVHHWILYRTREPQVDGSIESCNMPSDAVFVAGWAPGGGDFVLPDDVGLELGGPDDSFILQVHYNNTAGHQDAVDRSGVAFCTADEPRPRTAGVITLGSLGIAIPPDSEDYVVEGVCPSWMTSFLGEPLHVIASFPHMHELGRRFTTEILRGGEDGPAETLIDVDPFDFASQAFYPHPQGTMIEPGDALRTRCVYDNPTDATVYLGEGTSDEMCFNFAVVYPLEILGDTRSCGLL